MDVALQQPDGQPAVAATTTAVAGAAPPPLAIQEQAHPYLAAEAVTPTAATLQLLPTGLAVGQPSGSAAAAPQATHNIYSSQQLVQL